MRSLHRDSTDTLAGCLPKLLLGLLPFAALAGVALVVRLYGLGWGPQHRLSEPVAQLGPRVSAAIAEQAREVEDLDDAQSAALQITGALLHFGFRHRSELRFDQPRQGNSLEYAALFSVVFNQLASTAKLAAHAQLVHSEPTSLVGFLPSHTAFRSHDWVAIRDGDHERYVDPTLHDAWLGADISRNVQGSLAGARRVRTAPRPGQRPERLRSSLPPPKKSSGVAGILDSIGDRIGAALPTAR